jgi:hypothetical protein
VSGGRGAMGVRCHLMHFGCSDMIIPGHDCLL